jgi:hypothetical protein
VGGVLFQKKCAVLTDGVGLGVTVLVFLHASKVINIIYTKRLMAVHDDVEGRWKCQMA